MVVALTTATMILTFPGVFLWLCAYYSHYDCDFSWGLSMVVALTTAAMIVTFLVVFLWLSHLLQPL